MALLCRSAPVGESRAAATRKGTVGEGLAGMFRTRSREPRIAMAANAIRAPATRPLRHVTPLSINVDAVEITGEMATSSTQATAHPQPTAKRISQLS